LAKIIISYRRSDSDVFAGRVRDRIAGRYGEDSVFIDVDNIPFGKDFRVHIQEVMAEANAVLIVIGPKWLGAGKGGYSRIKDAADPVRIEVETELAKGTPTIRSWSARPPCPSRSNFPTA
jgi:TIR domain